MVHDKKKGGHALLDGTGDHRDDGHDDRVRRVVGRVHHHRAPGRETPLLRPPPGKVNFTKAKLHAFVLYRYCKMLLCFCRNDASFSLVPLGRAWGPLGTGTSILSSASALSTL